MSSKFDKDTFLKIVEILGPVLGFGAIAILFAANISDRSTLIVITAIAFVAPLFALIAGFAKNDFSKSEIIVLIVLMIFIYAMFYQITAVLKPEVMATLLGV